VQKWGSLEQVFLFVEVVTDLVAGVRAKVCMFAQNNIYVTKITFMSKSRECYGSLSRMLPHFSTFAIESTVTVLNSYWTTLTYFAQEREMLGTLSKTAVAATTALIIGLAPIATADLAFAHGGGGGGGGSRMGGGGGGHFGGGHFGGGQFGGGHFGEGHFAGGFARGAFRERGFHRHFGLFGGQFGDCGGPYSYPYPPYGPYGYGYNYCY
jgi:hypothetical protein